MVHRSLEPEFFRLEPESPAIPEAPAFRRRSPDIADDLVVDLTELELPKALVGSYLIG